jgi:hypothetical protein
MRPNASKGMVKCRPLNKKNIKSYYVTVGRFWFVLQKIKMILDGFFSMGQDKSPKLYFG